MQKRKRHKELTALVEQISGSDECKRDYEQFEEEKGAAEEKSALVYQKKKTVVMERKQKKEQKEEAEKHLCLQQELVMGSVSIYVCLCLLCMCVGVGCLLFQLACFSLM